MRKDPQEKASATGMCQADMKAGMQMTNNDLALSPTVYGSKLKSHEHGKHAS